MLTCGATAGFDPKTDLRYIWTFELQIRGSNSWTVADLETLLAMVGDGRLEPAIDRVLPARGGGEGFRRIEEREVFGRSSSAPDHLESRAAAWKPAGSCIPRIDASSARDDGRHLPRSGQVPGERLLRVEPPEGGGHRADLPRILHLGPPDRARSATGRSRRARGPAFAEGLERPRSSPPVRRRRPLERRDPGERLPPRPSRPRSASTPPARAGPWTRRGAGWGADPRSPSRTASVAGGRGRHA